MATSVTSLGSATGGDAWTRDSGNNYVDGWKIADVESYIRCLIGYATSGVSGTNGRGYFNQSIRFADYDNANFCGLFWQCANLNSPMYFGNYQTANAAKMFTQCQKFNQPVTINGAITNAMNMFQTCTVLNQPISITVADGCPCDYLLGGCSNFDQRVVINGNIGSASGMFSQVKGVGNYPVNLNFSSNVKAQINYICMDLVSSAPITIRCNQLTYSYYFAYNNTNIPVVIYANEFMPYSLDWAVGQLNNSTGISFEFHGNMNDVLGNVFVRSNTFNAPVTFDLKPIQDSYCLRDVFNDCPNFGSNVYLNRYINATNMFRYINANGHRKNVFCNNIRKLNNSSGATLVGTSISWTAMTNGYYNTGWNIYIYNNISNI